MPSSKIPNKTTISKHLGFNFNRDQNFIDHHLHSRKNLDDRLKKRDNSEDEETDVSKLNNCSLDQNLYLLTNCKSKEPLTINIAMFEQPLLKLTLVDILEATNNFYKSNIVSDNRFGTVYKAKLSDGKIVKKLNKSKTQGQREFLAEMETIGKVKLQNLVPLLGNCSFGEEKLLVYEYMVNESLDLWLRNRTSGTGPTSSRS